MSELHEFSPAQLSEQALAVQDFERAVGEYFAQRPADGSVPFKQIIQEDTIVLRAYRLFKARTGI
jgi:hypothetical protein